MKKFIFLALAIVSLSSFAVTTIEGTVTAINENVGWRVKFYIKPLKISAADDSLTKTRTSKNELIIMINRSNFCSNFIKSTFSSNGILTLQADLEDGNTVKDNNSVSCTMSKN